MKKNAPLLMDIGHGLFMMLGLPRIAVWKTNERPKDPKRGTLGFNSKTNSIEYYDGSDWFEAGLKKK